MFIKVLRIVIFLVTLSSCLYQMPLQADAEDAEKIKITLFKAHDDFTQTDTFKRKQPIILYVMWSIPESVTLHGEATIKIEGQRVGGANWVIKDKKDLRPGFASHYWGWDCIKKIPKKAKPGSAGTATVELSIKGFDTVKKSLNFKISED